MLRRKTSNILLFLIVLFFPYAPLSSQNTFRIVFYNVENLFDTKNDSLTLDDEFTPEGPRRWNYSRYNEKTHRIGQAILASGNGAFPQIIGLAEIENRGVIDHLLIEPPLSAVDYEIIHRDSPDKRGIDAALLFNPETFLLLRSHFFYPQNLDGYYSREIVCGSFQNKKSGDTLTVAVCHFPSRYRGYSSSQIKREQFASYLIYKIDSLSQVFGDYFILMGDFNDTPDGSSISILKNSEGEIPFVNLSDKWKHGTLKYQGTWELFDQILVSDSLFQTQSSMRIKQSGVFTTPFLLTDDEKFLGKKPFRSFIGFKYQQGGFSDHLPVFLEFEEE